jgi:hypothetical protein
MVNSSTGLHNLFICHLPGLDFQCILPNTIIKLPPKSTALSLESIGILGSISSIGVVLLNLGLGHLKASTGFLLGQLSVALFTLILWRSTSFPWFCVGYLLIGGYRISRSLATALTRNFVHQSRMGLAYGITETIGASAIILAPPVAGFLYQINPPLMYIVGFGLIIISILISARFILDPKYRYSSIFRSIII